MKLLETCSGCGCIVEVPYARLLDKDYKVVCDACQKKKAKPNLKVVKS